MGRVRLLFFVVAHLGVASLATSAPGIVDGTFEAGPNWPAWTTQTSTQFGTPLCNVNTPACFGNGTGTAGPYAGDNWAWFGGTETAPEIATVGQSVTLPRSPDVRLRFQMRIGAVTPPATDTLVVSVDGFQAGTFTEPSVAEAGYTLREVVLTGFADGGTHAQLFHYSHTHAGNSNFTVDNVELFAAPAPADLAIHKTDGQVYAAPGGFLTYTITASNPGPYPALGATVRDSFPAALSGVTWTCVASGGASCIVASGSGNIDRTVNLPVGGSVTFTAQATVSPAATGTVSNTATVDPPLDMFDPNPGNNSATDVDTVGFPADLSITKTDGQTTASPGQALTYTIVVGNAGPNPVTGATVSDPLPPGLTGATWTCAPSVNASCTPSGNGDILDSVDLGVGATVTYTLVATVSPTPQSVRNVASVSVPAGLADSDPSNNAATDDDFLTCASYVATVPDGRRTTHTVAAGSSQWFISSLHAGSSYSAEVLDDLSAGVAPVLEVFRGDDGCSGTSTAGTRDISLIDPPGGSVARASFVASGSDPVYRVRVDNASGGPVSYSMSIGETTLFSAAWSSLGSYETYYSLQNTSSAPVSGTLTLRDTTGAVVATGPLSIPAGRTVSTNTVGLGVAVDRTGTATFTHDGPPGSVLAAAAIANFTFTRPYVQVVRFEATREAH
jgi:uncharacterized repeat protein (TIGR01451 family)